MARILEALCLKMTTHITHNAPVNELLGLISYTFAEVESCIDHALEQGWRLPQGVAQKLSKHKLPAVASPHEYIAQLFQQFTLEVSFPESWTILEQFVLFGDLLNSSRGEGGLRNP